MQRPNEAQAIQNVQRYLRQLSFDEIGITAPPLDGIFDTATEQAIREYQRLSALPITGQADLETFTRLFADYERSLKKNRRSEGLSVFPNQTLTFTVRPEDEYFLVEVIQFVLNELGVWYDDIPKNGQSGIYDEATQQGILAFQKSNGLPPSRNIDRATWNALARAYRRMMDRSEL